MEHSNVAAAEHARCCARQIVKLSNDELAVRVGDQALMLGGCARRLPDSR